MPTRTTSSILSRPIPAPKIPTPAHRQPNFRPPGQILTEEDKARLGRAAGQLEEEFEGRQRQELSALDFLGASDLQPLQQAALPGVRTSLERQLRESTPRGASLLSTETRRNTEQELTLLGQAAQQRITGLKQQPGVVRAKGGLITRRRGLI